ncbi:hypothetical protein RHMOL_Rhmol01G0043200 [Rhododendron molle]|uniref:Uncharacterized protein n=1 Tax=Rhododendron molle TaxID=49168 RepID=A0ACC0PYK7_RHOML|nr:hypothetical protein RHMOL_Rhmol01G0043200 [Rhododendron molle]
MRSCMNSSERHSIIVAIPGVKEGVLTSKSAYIGVSAENNEIEENVKSRRSLAGERDSYVDVIDYAPAHASPPIHH